MATYYLGFAIIIEASLSFLGVGAPPDEPSWGGILTVASREAPETGIWLAGLPLASSYSFAVLAFNVLGDALRDVLDPTAARTVERTYTTKHNTAVPRRDCRPDAKSCVGAVFG